MSEQAGKSLIMDRRMSWRGGVVERSTEEVGVAEHLRSCGASAKLDRSRSWMLGEVRRTSESVTPTAQ